MMTVSSILHQTNNAKVAHIKWVRRINHLISGLPVEEKLIPLDPTFCEFGQWFYFQGSKLRTLDSLKEILEKIEKLHDELHDIYGKIYTIYFLTPHKRTLLHKIITLNNKEVKKEEKEEARNHYDTLIKISRLLISSMEKFEIAIKELGYHNAFKDLA